MRSIHIPDLSDSDAVLAAGRRALLNRARSDVLSGLRDTLTLMQSADWAGLAALSAELRDYASKVDDLVTEASKQAAKR